MGQVVKKTANRFLQQLSNYNYSCKSSFASAALPNQKRQAVSKSLSLCNALSFHAGVDPVDEVVCGVPCAFGFGVPLAPDCGEVYGFNIGVGFKGEGEVHLCCEGGVALLDAGVNAPVLGRGGGFHSVIVIA